MRFTMPVLFALSCVSVQSILAQDTPWQRITNLVTKGKADPTRPEIRPQASDLRIPTTTGAFETRGVVYVEEFQGPATPPKLVSAPRAPLTLPQSAPRAVRAQPAPVAVRPQPASTTAIRQVAAVKEESLSQRLTRRVSTACPQGRNVKVTVQSENEILVEMDLRTMDQANAMADQIFAIRDLDAYRVNLKFQVPQS